MEEGWPRWPLLASPTSRALIPPRGPWRDAAPVHVCPEPALCRGCRVKPAEVSASSNGQWAPSSKSVHRCSCSAESRIYSVLIKGLLREEGTFLNNQ